MQTLRQTSLSEIQDEVHRAEAHIRPHVRETELLKSILVPSRDAYLKMENKQFTGAFKARGSLNKLMSLTPAERHAGVVTASTGNHGLGVARSMQITGMTGTIFLPTYAQPRKVQALEKYGVPLEYVDGTWLDTEEHAKAEAARRGATWVSPYNDLKVIGGQGTIGLELASELETIDRIFITVGGGGLMSGVGGYLKSKFPNIRITACLPENSPEMYLSVQAGRVITLPTQKDTLSDGSAGALETTSMTFPICQAIIDDFRLVSEEEIAAAMCLVYEQTGEVIEGAAGVAVAGYLKSPPGDGTTDVVLICGGNIAEERFREVIRG